jgi:hypothetical protein
MAGRKREAGSTADISHFFSVEYTVFIKKIAYESVERHRAKPRSHTPRRRPLEICRLHEFEWTAFSRFAVMLNFGVEKL